MQGKTAVGVEVRRFGKVERYFARQEVVVSAGAIGSPQLLMLSGVGDTKHLEEVGVSPVHHLPAVGQNLQDHLITSVPVNTVDPLSVDLLGSSSPSAVLSYLSGEGPMTSAGACGGLAFIHTELSARTRPDIQLHLVSLSMATDYGLVLKDKFGLKEEFWPWFSKHSVNYSSTVAVTLSRPESRGAIKLRSNDPQDHPVIQPNYLTSQKDVDTLVAGVKSSLKLLDTNAMKKVGAQLWEAFPVCSADHQWNSQAYWECYVRYFSNTLYHPVGTCAMGTVLDDKLRVKGLKNLRVVDGSVMPTIVGGNTNAPIIMIAEKASDMILQDYKPQRTNSQYNDK